MTYCAGVNCKKRDVCAYHKDTIPDRNLSIDFSKPCGHAESHTDSYVDYRCGDFATSYINFLPIGVKPFNESEWWA